MKFASYIVSNTKMASTLPFEICKGSENKKNFAFTLAEVLITLTIIGVIAAMTIPTLMAKYQKQTYVARLKKAYSTLQNAFRMIPITANCPAGDYVCAGFWSPYETDNEMVSQNASNARAYLFSQNLKIKEACYLGDCKAKASVVIKNIIDNVDYKSFIILADGSYILPSVWSSVSDSPEILVDVNGAQGPNKPGRDRFGFFVTEDSKLLPVSGTCAVDERCYYYDSYEGKEKRCYSPSDNEGYACTTKVLRENAMNY